MAFIRELFSQKITANKEMRFIPSPHISEEETYALRRSLMQVIILEKGCIELIIQKALHYICGRARSEYFVMFSCQDLLEIYSVVDTPLHISFINNDYS